MPIVWADIGPSGRAFWAYFPRPISLPVLSLKAQAPRRGPCYNDKVRIPRLWAGLLLFALPSSLVHAAVVGPVRVAVQGVNAAASGAVMTSAKLLPSASENPALVLSLISSRYKTDPSPEVVADLGEGDFAEVRSGVMPTPAPLMMGVLPVAPGEPVAVKIPYLDPGGMIAHEAEVSRRLREAGGEELFAQAAQDPELNVLVMEKLKGYRTLDEWMASRSRIGPKTYKRIAAQLKRGLAVLEAAGLVHSDLKPDNVMVGPGMRVKIVDFGITAEEGAYPPYPDYDGWRGGLYVYTSENQLHNGPAAYADDRHSVDVMLSRLATLLPRK